MTDALLFHKDEVEDLDDWAGRTDRLDESTLLWIDLEDVDAAEIERLAEELELDEESVRRLGADETDSYLGDFESYLHVTAYAPCGEGHDLERVACLVSESWIVTVRDGPVEVLKELRERASGAGDVGRLQGIDVLADVLTWVLDGYLRAFEDIDLSVEEFDRRTMEGRTAPDDALRELVELRAQIGRLRRKLVSHRPVLLALTRPELGGISTTDSAERFESLVERLAEVTQAARDSREAVVGAFDVLMTRASQRTNEIMKVLTLASILLLPGTLLAGILGMNFKLGLFEDTRNFWLALAVMLGVAAATLVAARARRWV